MNLFSKIRKSLQLKLIITVIVVTSVIQGIFSANRIINEKEIELSKLEHKKNSISEELANGLIDPLWNFNLEQAKTLIRIKMKERDFIGIVIKDLETGESIIGIAKENGNIIETFKPKFKHSIIKRIDIKKVNEIHWKADCFFTDQYVKSIITKHIQYTILTLLGLISVLTVVLILILNVLVINPVRKITLLLKNIAEGDFSKRFTIKQTDEIGEISSEVNSLMNQLQDTFSEIIQNMESVSAGDFTQKITIDLKGDLDKLKSRINGSIEILSDRTEQLKIAQQELIDNAHRAGMADIASGTLHNVGNILNSVKVSAQLISERQESSSISNFIKANNLLRDHNDNLSDFILNDPKGLKLLEYYLKLEEVMIEESSHMKENLHRLNDKIDTITDVISAQQSFAGVSSLSEEYMLSDIVESALTLQIGSIERYGIQVIKKYIYLPKLFIQKTKLIHIIINLIKNARESMVETPTDQRKIIISITNDNKRVYLKIKDSGAGISQNNLKKIFNHGFTTKKKGHGFGLHSCANYMTEMGGNMWAESEGQGKGATFVLEFNLPT